jgi:hypothetical protein
MKVHSRIKSSGLAGQIEIVRDIIRPAEEPAAPPFDEDANPLYALAQLVEKLEAQEDVLNNTDSSGELSARSVEDAPSRTSLNEVEHYLNLFQKQSVVLRKLLTKLN